MLKHELWRSLNGLTSLCLSGPMGDDFRSLLEPGSELIGIIEGSSHFDVMTKYFELINWGKYETHFQLDYEPYPDDWKVIQDAAMS